MQTVRLYTDLDRKMASRNLRSAKCQDIGLLSKWNREFNENRIGGRCDVSLLHTHLNRPDLRFLMEPWDIKASRTCDKCIRPQVSADPAESVFQEQVGQSSVPRIWLVMASSAIIFRDRSAQKGRIVSCYLQKDSFNFRKCPTFKI